VHRAPDGSFRFGEHRVRAGWVGIIVAAGALLVTTPPLIATGAPEPVLIIAPILLGFGLLCAVTRTVSIDPASRSAAIERRLLGLAWRRVVALAGAHAVAVEWFWAQSRHARSDGTLLGDQRFMHYRIVIDGHPRIALDCIGSDAARAEAVARAVAGALGLPAERRGYALVHQPGDALLARQRKGLREPIAVPPARG
jgi:hypothetical protein